MAEKEMYSHAWMWSGRDRRHIMCSNASDPKPVEALGGVLFSLWKAGHPGMGLPWGRGQHCGKHHGSRGVQWRQAGLWKTVNILSGCIHRSTRWTVSGMLDLGRWGTSAHQIHSFRIRIDFRIRKGWDGQAGVWSFFCTYKTINILIFGWRALLKCGPNVAHVWPAW